MVIEGKPNVFLFLTYLAINITSHCGRLYYQLHARLRTTVVGLYYFWITRLTLFAYCFLVFFSQWIFSHKCVSPKSSKDPYTYTCECVRRSVVTLCSRHSIRERGVWRWIENGMKRRAVWWKRL